MALANPVAGSSSLLYTITRMNCSPSIFDGISGCRACPDSTPVSKTRRNKSTDCASLPKKRNNRLIEGKTSYN